MSEVSLEPCPACRAPNRSTAKFCRDCGSSLAREISCPSCGATQGADQRFCDECGVPLDGRAPGQQGRSSTASRRESEPTSFLAGRYDVVRFLGEGARKRVYLARDRRLQREVAVSAFKSDGVDVAAMARARREAEAMGRLGDHPNLVTVHDIGEEDGRLFLVTQYMAGGDLAGLLEKADDRRLPIADVVRIATDLAGALEHAHAHGVVHRDVKPQNVWLTPAGTAALGDFGLAMALDRSRLTHEGTMIGTVAYMPPEQGLGREADARSDLYSVGAVMYELACGMPPFPGGDAAAVISQHISAVPVAPSWHRPDIPKALEQLILKLLAKTPDARVGGASELREALEAIDTATSPAADSMQLADAALDRLTDGSFRGREKERKHLRGAVDQALAGRGRLVMVAGEAGIGKTRLASEVETYADLRGAQVLRGQCYEGEGAPPYWPWIQVIRAYAQGRDAGSLALELGSGASDIAKIVSDLRGTLPDIPEPQTLEPQQARFRLFDSLATFLRNASGSRPLTIFLEDLHLADTPSLLFLQFLARQVSSVRIFVLATYRDDELGANHPIAEMHAALAHERSYERLAVRGLSQEEVKAVLEDLSRQQLESPQELALVRAVSDISAGNPSFIEEIVRHLVESGGIYESDGRWRSDARHVDELRIPQGIREAVGRRLSRLPKGCREALGIAAAIGQEFALPTLVRVSGHEPAAVIEQLRPAADAAIIVAVPEQAERYRFTHGAAREALYEDLEPGRRVQLHSAIGEALEDLYGDRVEPHLAELAHHFARAAPAGFAERAVDYAWWAAERAVAVAAYEEAVEHYTRALGLLATLSDEPLRRCELMLALGDASWRSGDAAGARQTFVEAAEAAERHSLPEQYARAALGFGGGIGGLSASARADERLIELLRNALDMLPDRDTSLRVRTIARLAVELYYTDRADEADLLSGAAVEMADRLGDARIILLAKYSRLWATIGPDSVDEQLTVGAEIARLARSISDAEMEFKARQLVIDALLQLGDVAALDREIGSCQKLAKALRQPAYDWNVEVLGAMRALLAGRFEDVERSAQAAAAVGQHGQGEIAGVVFATHTFFVNWAAGKLDGLVGGGEALAARYPRSAWPAALTWLLTEVNDLPAARSRFDALAQDSFGAVRRDLNWMTAITCLSVVSSELGDGEAADVLYEMMRPYAGRCTSVLTGAATFGSTDTVLGLTAETAGRLDQAAQHFERALAMHESMGAVFVPRICLGYARTLLARDGAGDRERAAALVEKGLDVARELGLPREAERLLALKVGSRALDAIDVQTSIDAVVRSVEQAPPDLQPAAAPDGTVTLMFSDIEDSTAMTERLGDRRWLELLRKHNEIVRRHVAQHNGYEVKSQGDGFMIAFASAAKAVRCAIEVQRSLAAHRAERPDDPLKVRIGLHTGEALRDHEDFFGKNVILAARIAAQATGGQILVSNLLRELVASSADFEFGADREVALKGLSGTYRIWEVVSDPEPAARPRPVPPRRRHDSAGVPSLPPHLRHAAAAPCVERAVERDLLGALWRRARDGEMRAALLGGEAGIGRTRLAAHAALAAHDEGALVLYGRCDASVTVPYRPWVQALTRYVELAPPELLGAHVQRHGGELGRLVPELARRVPAAAVVRSSDPETERHLAFAAVVDLLGTGARDTPLLVVLDDLHWADSGTIALLRHVLQQTGEARMLVVGTYRDTGDETDHPLGQVVSEPAVEDIRLSGLDEKGVVALVEGLLGSPLDADGRRLAREIAAETDGNPFFTAELVRQLRDDGHLVTDDAGRVGSARADLDAPEMPAGLRGVIRRRVARLGEDAVAVLSAAAVLGRDFELEELARVCGRGRTELTDVVGAAVDAAVLRELSDPPGRFGFAQALIGHTLYEDLDTALRGQLHHRAAEALEKLHGDAPGARTGDLAHHWASAIATAGAEKAVEWALAAGRHALASLAPGEAVRWFGRALTLAEEHPFPPALRVDARIALGEAQRQSGIRAHRETLLTAARMALELEDGERLARAALANHRRWSSVAGNVDDERIEILEAAIELGPHDARMRACLLALLGLERTYGGNLAERRRLSDEALAVARASEDTRTLAYVLGRRYTTIWAPETLDDRRETVDELESAADLLNDPTARIGAASWRFNLALETGAVTDAWHAIERKAEEVERIGRPVLRWELLLQRSVLAYLAGRLDEAERFAVEAAEAGHGEPDVQPITGAQIVAVRYDQGRLDEFVDQFADVAERNQGLFEGALALVYCELDRHDEARSLVARAAATRFAGIPRDNLWLTTAAAYADACSQIGDAHAAEVLYALMEPYGGRIAVNGANASGSTHRYLALLAATLGRKDEAERHFAAAEATHDRIGAPIFLARTRFEWGRMLLADASAGDTERGRQLLDEALAAAREHGCASLVRRIEATMARADA